MKFPIKNQKSRSGVTMRTEKTKSISRLIRWVGCGLLLLGAAVSAGAVTKTWGGSTGNWSDPSAWSPTGVPATTDDVVVNSGTLTVDIGNTGSIGAFFASLTCNGGTIVISSGRVLSGTKWNTTNCTTSSAGSLWGYGTTTGTATYAGPITLTASTASFSAGVSNQLYLTGGISGNYPVAFTFGTGSSNGVNGDVYVDGNINIGNNAVTKNGNGNAGSWGTLYLRAANSYTGQTLINSGTLVATNANSLGSTVGNTVVSSGASLALQGGITIGAEPLTISGNGYQLQGALYNNSGNNEFKGAITQAAASTIRSASGTLTLSGGITGDYLLTFQGDNTTIVNSVIGIGANQITKNDAGTLVLSGANTYTGITNITGGTLQVGNGGTTGNIDNNSGTTVGNGAALKFNRSNAYSSTKVIGGAGTVEQAGAGITTFTAVNTYTGATTVSNGTLVLQSGRGASPSFAISSGATLDVSAGVAGTVSFSGLGTLKKSVTGDWALANQTFGMTGGLIDIQYGNLTGNSLTGWTDNKASVNLASGTQVNICNSTWYIDGLSGSGDIYAGGFCTTNTNVGVNNYASATYDGTFTYSGGGHSLTKLGTGTQILTSNTIDLYGGLNITGGTLQLGAGGTTGDITARTGAPAVAISSGALFKINRSNAFSLWYNMSGAGGLEQAGVGTTTLSSAAAYTGTTKVSAGKLIVTGSTSTGATTVMSAATLGGTGTLNNTVTVQNGGHLAPGVTAGTITVSGLVLNSGSILDMELGQVGTVGGSYNDLVQDNGALTLSGAAVNVSVSSGGSLVPGKYRLINYTGTCTGCSTGGLVIGTVPSGTSTSQYSFEYLSTAVNLIVADSVANVYWDVAPQNNSVVNGGTGIWYAPAIGGNTNWTTSSGAVNGQWTNGGTAVFQASAGSAATVDNSLGAINISGLTFSGTGVHTVSGGTLTGTAANNVITGGGNVNTISAVLAGSNPYEFKSSNSIVLSGANTFTGNASVTSGFVTASNSAALGVSNAVTVTDAALTVSSGVTMTQALTLNATAERLEGNVSGAGSTWSGPVTLSGTGSFNYMTVSGTVNLNANTLYMIADGGDLTISGKVSGSGTVDANYGLYYSYLSGANDYTGPTYVRSGNRLVAAHATALGTTAGGTFVLANGELNMQGGITIVGEPLSITGLGYNGLGAFVNKSGNNTFQNGITLTGAAAIGSSSGTMSLPGNITGNYDLTLYTATGANINIGGVIGTNASALTKGWNAVSNQAASSGTATLTGTNTYTGITSITAGTLVAGNASALGTATAGTTVASGSSLALQGGFSFPSGETLSIVGTGNSNVGALYNLSGDNTWNGAISLTGAASIGSSSSTNTLTIAAGITGTNTNLSFLGAGNTSVSGVVGLGTGALSKTGTGTLTLSGNNTYTGTTSIGTGGTLVAAHNNALGTTTAGTSVASGGALALQNNITIATEALSIAGTGVSNSGALYNDTGINTYQGNITQTAASTIGTTAGSTLTLSGNISGAFALTFASVGDTTVSGVVGIAAGTVSKSGTGTLTLSGTNTYIGTTTVSGGALQVDGSTSTGATTIQSNATLKGIGTLSNAVTVQSGGHLAPGQTGAGSITMSSLSLNTGAVLDMDLSRPNVIGGSDNDLVKDNGALTLGTGVTLNLTATGGGTFIPNGTYRLINYSGSCTGCAAGALTIGTVPSGNAAANFTISYATANQVNLIVSNATNVFTYWDGSAVDKTANSAVEGGLGTWNISTRNWTNSGGTTEGYWSNTTSSVAQFGGTAGTVTVDIAPGTINIGGITFGVTGYTLSAGTLTGTASSNVLTAGTGISATIGSVLAGTNAFDKQGAGTVTMTGANTYTGTTSVTAGTLEVGSGGTSGSIDSNSSTSVASGATLKFNRSDSVNVTKAISGAGSLTFNGGGTFTLSAVNPLSGAVTINGATVVTQLTNLSTGAFGAASSVTVNSGGILRGQGDNGVFGPSYPTPASLTLNVGGKWDLAGTTQNTYGAMTFAGGELASNTTTSGWGSITYYGSSVTVTANSTMSALGMRGAWPISVNSGVTLSVSGAFESSASITKSGAGLMAMSGPNNTYTGSTTVSGGTLRLDVNSAMPTATPTTVGAAGTLDLNSKTQTLSNGLAATGTLALGTNGQLTLSGGSSTIAGANVTGSGKIIVGSGASLTLTSRLSNSNVSIELAGGTLYLGLYLHSIGTLTVSQASTLDFASAVGASGLNVNNLSMTATGTGLALTVNNWTKGTDQFQATSINSSTTTPARGLGNQSPLNRIKMGSEVLGATVWTAAAATPANEITTGVATVIVRKQTSGGAGGPFAFSQVNLASAPGNLTTATANTPVDAAAVNVTTVGADVTITETPQSPYTLSTAVCTDTSSALTGNTGSTFAQLSNGVLTIPAANVVAGATFSCLFTNTFNSLTHWDGPNTSSGGSSTGGDGGVGVWDTAGKNWTNATGSLNGIWDNDNSATAIFEGTAGTVTVSAVKIGGMTFSVTGYQLQSSTLTMSAHSTLTVTNASDSATVGSVLAGAYNVTKAGAGKLVLSGTNTYTGTTTVSVGTLNVQNASGLGTTAGGTSVTSGAALALEGGISIGTEALTLNGTGVSSSGALYNVSGINTYGGGITLNSASTIAATAGTLNLSGTITNSSNALTLAPSASTTINLNGIVGAGSGGLTQNGAGTSVLGALNTYTGTTTVTTGTLQLGVSSALPSGSATTVNSGASLDLNGKSQTLSAGLTASGSLKLGLNGTLTLSGGSSTIAGANVTGSGKIVVSSGATLTLSSDLSNTNIEIELAGGTLKLDNGTARTHSIGKLTISAASTVDFGSGLADKLAVGNLAVTATGTAQVLTVANWIKGSDEFTAGQIGGSTTTPVRSTGGVSPLSRIMLGGAPLVATVWTPATATPANEISTGTATVTVQKTTSGGYGGPFSFTQTNLASTPASITTTAANTATTTSSGAIAITALGVSVTLTENPASPYTLTSAVCTDGNAGSTGNSGNSFAVLNAGVLTIPAANVVAGSAFTCVFTNGYNALTYWDGGSANKTANNAVEGGAGTWNITLQNWTNAGGTFEGIWDNNNSATAMFGGPGATVTVDSGPGTINIGGMTFDSLYTLSGTGSLNATGATTTLTVNVNASLLVPLSGGSGASIVKAGAAQLDLDRNNTFDGSFSLNAGSVYVEANNAFGSTVGSTTMQTGTLIYLPSAGLTVPEALTVTGSGSYGTIGNYGGSNTWSGAITANARLRAFVQAGTLTLSGAVGGTDGLQKDEAATLVLSGTGKTYAGSTLINAGTLQSGVTNAIPTASATTVASGATLDLNGNSQTLSAGLTDNGALALGTGGVLTLSGGNSTIAGAGVTGSGKIVVSAGATLTLTSDLSNTGVEIDLAGGTLNLGVHTHSIGTLTVSVAGSTLDFATAGTAQIRAGTLAIGSGMTLAVTNWTRGTDKFYATAFTGATRNVIGAAPMNRITMGSYVPAYTVWQSDDEINVLLNPKLRIAKTSTGGVGTFNFTMTGLSATADAITTVTSGTKVDGTAGLLGTSGTAVTITESNMPSGWPSTPASASCVDNNGMNNSNGMGTFGTLAGAQLSVPAANMIAGADISCTFVNSLNGLSGFVFNDGGAPSGGVNTGTPNDGLKNGSEAGLVGVAVTLTDCGATTHASTATDNNGAWSLNVPANVAAGTTVCVNAAVPATRVATGANAGGTAVPDGSTVTVSGVAYTYTRASQRLSFGAPASGVATMSFGQVPRSTFSAAGAHQGASNTAVTYAHTFSPGTGGSVVFGITGEVATPPNANAVWSGLIYADTGCTGTLQTGATQLYPGNVATTVVQGQPVCVIVKELVPAAADNGTVNQTTVQASLTFTNASPALSANYTLVDSTTVGASALALLKEVRNVTTSGTFSASNQAKSGQVLEYRIGYTNTTAAPMTKVVIADSVPAYTTFESATAGTTATALGNCTMNTPANQVPAPAVSCTTTQPAGGTGVLKWMFDGTLNPGVTGEVSFRVLVD